MDASEAEGAGTISSPLHRFAVPLPRKRGRKAVRDLYCLPLFLFHRSAGDDRSLSEFDCLEQLISVRRDEMRVSRGGDALDRIDALCQ